MWYNVSVSGIQLLLVGATALWYCRVHSHNETDCTVIKLLQSQKLQQELWQHGTPLLKTLIYKVHLTWEDLIQKRHWKIFFMLFPFLILMHLMYYERHFESPYCKDESPVLIFDSYCLCELHENRFLYWWTEQYAEITINVQTKMMQESEFVKINKDIN